MSSSNHINMYTYFDILEVVVNLLESVIRPKVCPLVVHYQDDNQAFLLKVNRI
jgi:hypothetical protein